MHFRYYSSAYDGGRRTLRKLPSGGVDVTIGGMGVDEPLVRIDEAGARHFYHQDRIGSVYMITDSAGKVVESYDYTAYGEMQIYDATGKPIGASTIYNRLGFQGQAFDAALGLVDMRARTYLPRWGRFLSRDPIGYRAGSNLYAFVGGAPLLFTDPWGLDKCPPYARSAEWAYQYSQMPEIYDFLNQAENSRRNARAAEQRQADVDEFLKWINGAGRIVTGMHTATLVIVGGLLLVEAAPVASALAAKFNATMLTAAGATAATARTAGSAAQNWAATYGSRVSQTFRRFGNKIADLGRTALDALRGEGSVASGEAATPSPGDLDAARQAFSQVLGARVAQIGDHVVLGLDNYGLRSTAANLGGRHLMRLMNFKESFGELVGSPNTYFTVSLDGVGLPNSSVTARVLSAVQRGMLPDATPFNWEMAQLYQAGRLSSVTFIEDGGKKLLGNPF